MVLEFGELRLPGVQRVPPMLEAVDHEMPPFAATSAPRPPFGPPWVESKPSVVSELLSLMVPHAQSAWVKVAAASAPLQANPMSTPSVGSPAAVQFGPGETALLIVPTASAGLVLAR